jgi:hypothetical protein
MRRRERLKKKWMWEELEETEAWLIVICHRKSRNTGQAMKIKDDVAIVFPYNGKE